MAATLSVAAPARRDTARTGHPGNRGRFFTAFCTFTLVVFAIIWVIPLLWALDTSIRPEGEITTNPTSWWTNHPTLSAYTYIINHSDLPNWYLNSVITSALTALFTIIVCSMAGFALARTRMRGRKSINGFLLAGILIPSQVLIIPMFKEFDGIGLLNTYWALILPGIAAPVAVFIFASFFAGIPVELAEAARADGAGWFRIYSRIFMPLCKPAISAVAIFIFVATWNGFLWPLLTLTSTKTMTIPVGLASVQSAYGIIYGQVMATAVLGALPLLIVFLLFQRRIVEGVSTTGIR